MRLPVSGGREDGPRTGPPRPPYELAPRPPEGPVDLETLAPGVGPLELDIGFGRGLSLFERAAVAPDSRILGLELKQKWVYLVDRRIRRMELHQVRVFAADARDLLSRSGPAACVRRASLHFPDPWWKKRHAKRKVLGADMLDHLGHLLVPGGELFVQTDVHDRAEEFVALLRAHPGFALQSSSGFVDANPWGARSNRERRALADGVPVYRILAATTTRPRGSVAEFPRANGAGAC